VADVWQSAKQDNSTTSKPGFWIIAVLLVLISVPHYRSTSASSLFNRCIDQSWVNRHAFERILYLIPIFLAGFLYGWPGSFITSILALALMLPRTFIISQYTIDAIFETFGIFIIGNILTITFEALRKEKEQRMRLESTHQKLKESERKFKQLFENAHDAIFIHDPEGNIITTNMAGETLTGYSLNELGSLKMKEIMAEESWLITGAIEQMILGGEDAARTIEARLIKKDKNQIFVHLSIGLNERSTNSISFQCTARDISEQKRMQKICKLSTASYKGARKKGSASLSSSMMKRYRTW
jgi:PAS domain S-box-containing protein